MKLLIVEDDRMLNDGITLSLKADADAILQACTLAEAEKLFCRTRRSAPCTESDMCGRSRKRACETEQVWEK